MISVTKLLGGPEFFGDRLRYDKSSHAQKHGTRDGMGPVVVWNSTKTCNLECIHCYASAKKAKFAGEMTTEEAKAMIDDLASFHVPALLMSGGEPLVRPDILDLAEYATTKGIRITFSTNGILITEKIAERMARIGVTYAGISIDGDEPRHDHMRGKAGAFQETLKGIRNCCKYGIRVGLRFTATAENIGDIDVPAIVALDDRDWRVLVALKRDLAVDEVSENVWAGRAKEAGVSLDEFYEVAESLDRRGVVGRFSTFLEHTKPVGDASERLSSFNGLFHWAVPKGKEIEAGREIGRYRILTHCYWRDGGPELNDVNIFAVAHGETKEQVMAYKAAIDRFLVESGIGLDFTNVYWGGRAEIKPSEIAPSAYREWATQRGLL
jgi:pyruvate-formate lyase-activating enzyme